MNCPFCQIALGQRSAHLLYENDEVLAFLDAFPMAPGHTLVIPRLHVERLSQLSEEQAGQILAAAVRVGRALEAVLNASGFTLGLNDGRVAGQGVPHLHLHLVPRFSGDGGGSIHTIFPPRALRPNPELAAKVRALLTSQGN